MELTANAFNSLQGFITPNFLNRASAMLGLPADKTKSALTAAMSAVYDALTQRASDPAQANDMMNVIREGGYDQAAVNESQPIETQASAGQNYLSRVLGGKADALTGKIASVTGVNAAAAAKITGLASTAVFAFLGSKLKAGNWSPAAFSSVTGSAADIIPGSSATWIWIAVAALIAGILWWLAASRTTTMPVLIEETTTEITAVPEVQAPGQTPSAIIEEISAFLSSPNDLATQTFTLNELKFSSDSTELSAGAEQLLANLAKVLATYPNARVVVEGHTDNIGDPAFNQQLSMQRAQTVRESLMEKGVSADRIEAVGLGGSRPVADNTTEGGRELNRRTDLLITR